MLLCCFITREDAFSCGRVKLFPFMCRDVSITHTTKLPEMTSLWFFTLHGLMWCRVEEYLQDFHLGDTLRLTLLWSKNPSSCHAAVTLMFLHEFCSFLWLFRSVHKFLELSSRAESLSLSETFQTRWMCTLHRYLCEMSSLSYHVSFPPVFSIL